MPMVQHKIACHSRSVCQNGLITHTTTISAKISIICAMKHMTYSRSYRTRDLLEGSRVMQLYTACTCALHGFYTACGVNPGSYRGLAIELLLSRYSFEQLNTMGSRILLSLLLSQHICTWNSHAGTIKFVAIDCGFTSHFYTMRPSSRPPCVT